MSALLRKLSDSLSVAESAKARGVDPVQAFREVRSDISAEINRNIAKAQIVAEERLEQDIAAFLTHSDRYAHGGLSNMLNTVARVWENLHEDNWYEARKIEALAEGISK